jgi:hypothetical protein
MNDTIKYKETSDCLKADGNGCVEFDFSVNSFSLDIVLLGITIILVILAIIIR